MLANSGVTFVEVAEIANALANNTHVTHFEFDVALCHVAPAALEKLARIIAQQPTITQLTLGMKAGGAVAEVEHMERWARGIGAAPLKV